MPRTLVVSAFEPEVEPLRRLVRRTRGLEMTPVGIGAVDAAVGAARAISAARAERVIFVGTAGVYGAGKAARAAIGTAAVAGELFCVSTAALRNDGYLPGPMVLRIETSRRLRPLLAGAAEAPAPPLDVACPLAITRSAAVGRRIAAATGAALENLEAFSVARASAAAGVEFGAVLGVANRVAPTGHDEWSRHHRAASRAACELVARFLDGRPDGA
ncbi:MAG TPA: phosphorylase [Polyangia bacterium]|nr:phosphorylase [Polyangia bacterium]